MKHNDDLDDPLINYECYDNNDNFIGYLLNDIQIDELAKKYDVFNESDEHYIFEIIKYLSIIK